MKKLKQTEEVEAQKCASLKKRHKTKFMYGFISVLIVALLIGSSLLQITVSNNLTTQGIALAKIQDQIDALKKENMLLAERVYTDASYNHIASQAASLGFVEAKSALFITDQGPLALKQ